MEISFNPSNIPDPAANQPVARRSETPSVQDAASFENADALKNSIKDIPLVRTEQVARARALVADTQYPPNYVLDRIANLLALHIK